MNRQERKEWYYNQTHKIIEGVIYKQCTQCQEWKIEEEEFYLHNKAIPKKGYSPECKACSSKRAREIALKNPERTKQSVEKWQQDNIIQYRKVRKDYNDSNKEKIYKYCSEWYKKNPDKTKEYSQRHRKHDITNTEWVACKDYFDNSCAYCGLSINDHRAIRNDNVFNMDLHKEHVDDNGANDLSNCVPSCQNCNSTKANKTLDEFLEFELIPEFNQEKYNKIIKWITEDYKQFAEEKPPYLITRKQNENSKTYHWELWSVDEKRNFVECLAIANKKAELKPYIKQYFNITA